MIRRFIPGPICGSVRIPPSKSYSHRYLIAAALADGESIIDRLSDGDDVLATLDCLRKCGVMIEKDGDGVSVRAKLPEKFPDGLTLDCRESGSTLRFLIPLLLRQETAVTLIGSGSLLARPLSVYQTICEKQGLIFERNGNASLKIGGRLHSGTFTFPGDISSQFVTGLLFALPLLSRESRIELQPPVESRSYIEMTLAVLAESGIRIDRESDAVFSIPGNQTYRPFAVTVEGDCSAAAYFHALNALPGNHVSVFGESGDTLQGDAVFPTYLEKIRQGFCTLAVDDCPDLAPLLAVTASLFFGCTLVGTHRLKFKESDRANAIAGELSKCGVSVSVEENGMTVRPVGLHAPSVPLDSHGDHRIAMSLSVLLSAVGGQLSGSEAVAKSFPGFYALWQEKISKEG